MASRIPLAVSHVHPAIPPGEELRRIRQHLRLSQKKFAQRLGTHAVSLARWESGARPPPATIMYLARLLLTPHVPWKIFIPDAASPDEPVVHVEPGDGPCRWRGEGGLTCSETVLRCICQVSRRQRLVAMACREHLWSGYQTLK